MALDRHELAQKAASLAAQGIYGGSSSWKYPGWCGMLYDPGVTAEDMDKYVWVKPQVAAKVKFTEWTTGGVLGHGESSGLRDDKAPAPSRAGRPGS